jgi:hypothetical protein
MINEKNTTLKSYKGFNKDLKCRDFQYEVGKEYETDRAIVCEEGFHACTDPLAVWDYYSPCDNNRFCEVEQGGEIEKEESTSKVSSTKIKIKAEIGIAGLVKAHIDILKESTINKIKEWVGKKDIDKNSAQIGSSGYYAKIGSSGDSAKIGSSGYYAKIGSSGDYAKIGSSGDSAKIGSSGDSAQIGSSGDSAQIGSSGYYAKIGSSGDSAKIGSSGDSAKIGSSGDSAKIGSSGYYAKIGSSGDYAKIGSSGDSAKIGSSGYYAKIGSSGYYAKIDSTGERAVIANIGCDGVVKAEKGSWVTLAEYGESTQDEKGRWYRPCECVKSFKVTSKQSGKWLALKNGKVVEVKL